MGDIGGESREEDEPGPPPFARRLPDGSRVLDGLASVRDVRALLALPIEESKDYRTVAGFLIHSLGVIPKPGASLTLGGYRWTVVDMGGPKITQVKVEPFPRRWGAGAPRGPPARGGRAGPGGAGPAVGGGRDAGSAAEGVDPEPRVVGERSRPRQARGVARL